MKAKKGVYVTFIRINNIQFSIFAISYSYKILSYSNVPNMCINLSASLCLNYIKNNSKETRLNKASTKMKIVYIQSSVKRCKL